MGCGRREAQEGGDICIFMLICVVVWQNPTQHCKAIILQLKKNKIKNKSQAYSLRSRISKEVKGDSGTNTLKQKLTFYLYLHQECSYFLISHTHTPAHGHTHILKQDSSNPGQWWLVRKASPLAPVLLPSLLRSLRWIRGCMRVCVCVCVCAFAHVCL